jgi:hypothetical protein
VVGATAASFGLWEGGEEDTFMGENHEEIPRQGLPPASFSAEYPLIRFAIDCRRDERGREKVGVTIQLVSGLVSSNYVSQFYATLELAGAGRRETKKKAGGEIKFGDELHVWEGLPRGETHKVCVRLYEVGLIRESLVGCVEFGVKKEMGGQQYFPAKPSFQLKKTDYDVGLLGSQLGSSSSSSSSSTTPLLTFSPSSRRNLSDSLSYSPSLTLSSPSFPACSSPSLSFRTSSPIFNFCPIGSTEGSPQVPFLTPPTPRAINF